MFDRMFSKTDAVKYLVAVVAVNSVSWCSASGASSHIVDCDNALSYVILAYSVFVTTGT